jgi:hypothetical protein
MLKEIVFLSVKPESVFSVQQWYTTFLAQIGKANLENVFLTLKQQVKIFTHVMFVVLWGRESGERGKRGERGERAEGSERAERAEKAQRAERAERGKREERAERAERGKRMERGERRERVGEKLIKKYNCISDKPRSQKVFDGRQHGERVQREMFVTDRRKKFPRKNGDSLDGPSFSKYNFFCRFKF